MQTSDGGIRMAARKAEEDDNRNNSMDDPIDGKILKIYSARCALFFLFLSFWF